MRKSKIILPLSFLPPLTRVLDLLSVKRKIRDFSQSKQKGNGKGHYPGSLFPLSGFTRINLIHVAFQTTSSLYFFLVCQAKRAPDTEMTGRVTELASACVFTPLTKSEERLLAV